MVRIGRLAVAVAFVLAGCHFGADAIPEITVKDAGLDGVTYYPYADAIMTGADVTAIGQAEGGIGELVSDRTVYSIAGVDPSTFVALRIDSDRYAEWVRKAQEAEPGWIPPATAPTYKVFAANSDEVPAEAVGALCGYFDPRSDGTPITCQAAITVTFNGEAYGAIVESESMKVVPFRAFHSSDLQAVGVLTDVDPRLYFGPDVDTTAYAARGVDISEALVVVAGKGLDATYYVFLANADVLPDALCQYADTDFSPLIGCGGGDSGDDAALTTVHDQERTWYAHDVVEYIFTIDVVCDCPPEAAGPFTIRVVGSDLVDSISIGTTRIEPDDERAAWVPKRMNEAFEAVARYVGSDQLDVQYDTEYGFPLHLFADPAPDRQGDEYGFTITDFEVVR